MKTILAGLVVLGWAGLAWGQAGAPTGGSVQGSSGQTQMPATRQGSPCPPGVEKSERRDPDKVGTIHDPCVPDRTRVQSVPLPKVPLPNPKP